MGGKVWGAMNGCDGAGALGGRNECCAAARLFLALRTRKNMPKAARASTAAPPITPPTMAPTAVWPCDCCSPCPPGGGVLVEAPASRSVREDVVDDERDDEVVLIVDVVRVEPDV